ncbi:MAG TPA: hypothetical protein VGO92_02735, partial [Acidimicrobiales bacterium]|nr:hypothetical protein [Acidimicrobiales bacterium]
ASAYQFVIQTSGPVRLTHEGWFQLWRIRKELLDLKNSGLSPPEMQARIDFLAKQAYQVVSTSLVPADKNQNDAQRDHQDEATTTTSSAVERSTSTSTSTTSPSTSSTSTSTSTTSTSTP